MTPSQTCIDLIKKWEGCRLEAYKDVGGVWTVGYGTTGPGVKEGTIYTQEQADKFLVDRATTIARIIDSCVLPVLNQNQIDALTCLCYNIGQHNFRGSTLLRLVNTRKYKDAAEEFLRWNKVKGAVVAGLTERREAEKRLFLS